ncbi:Serine/threonine-protein kinase dclk3, partial [Podochytrium sp. JEL0797]
CHVRESFRREVEFLRLCRPHPNIIRLIDSWESMHTVYQVFDVCNGGDAAVEGAFRGVNEERAVRLIAPIADALRYLHRRQILHRDVRPANIFLRRSITGHETLRELEHIPVLADFGIANYTKNSGRLAAPFPETPPHIAPEIIGGARFTTASDCYGLGYYSMHMLLHRQPALEDVRYSGEIVAPGTGWDGMSEVGKRAVGMLLFKDPKVRTTASEFCACEWVVAQGVDCVKHDV